VFEGELLYFSSTACTVVVVTVSFCFGFWFFTSGLFTFEEFIEKLKAKVKALCAMEPLSSLRFKLGRTGSQTLSFS